MGVDGVYARTGLFEQVVNGLTALITEYREPGTEVLRFPPVMSRRQVEKSGYLKSFPHFLGCVSAWPATSRDIRAAVDRHEAGERWTTSLVAGRSRACAGRLLSGLSARGEPRTCARQTACCSTSPATASAANRRAMLDRLQSFRMREYVCIGTPEEIDEFRRRWMRRARALRPQLGLSWRMDYASDPFFGRGGKLKAVSQVEQALKFELLVPVHSTEQPTACMSFNYHRDHFGTTWNIHTMDRRGGAHRLRGVRHGSAGGGDVRDARARTGALAGRRAQSADD